MESASQGKLDAMIDRHQACRVWSCAPNARVSCCNQITSSAKATWYRAPSKAFGSVNARTMPHKYSAWRCTKSARKCQPQNARSPQLSGLQVFLLAATDQRRTPHHSHSIVAGGLLDTSYVTREIPSISLMMRPETVSSSSYGRCAQRAVMKSMVSTARRATTQA